MASTVFSFDTSQVDPMDSTYEDSFLELGEEIGSQAVDSLPSAGLLDAIAYFVPDHSQRHDSPGMTEIAAATDVKPKRSRRASNNPYGRAGCKRCVHCRKWKQKCVYESLDRPCKLCEKYNRSCSLEEKVLGPKTQSNSGVSEWIDPQTGHLVLSVSGLASRNSSSDKQRAVHESTSDHRTSSLMTDPPAENSDYFELPSFPLPTTCDQCDIFGTQTTTHRHVNRATPYFKLLSQRPPKSPPALGSEWSLNQQSFDQIPSAVAATLPQLLIQPDSVSMEPGNVANFDTSNEDRGFEREGIVSIEAINYSSQLSSQKSAPTCFPCSACSEKCVYKPGDLRCESCTLLESHCWFESPKPDNGSASLNETILPQSLSVRENPAIGRNDSRVTEEVTIEVDVNGLKGVEQEKPLPDTEHETVRHNFRSSLIHVDLSAHGDEAHRTDHEATGSSNNKTLSSVTSGFNFLENTYLRTFLQRKLLEVLPIPPPSYLMDNADSGRIMSLILGPLASKAICYGALAYECLLEDADSATALRSLNRCIKSLSTSSGRTPTAETAYARWLIIKVSFELSSPLDLCLREVVEYSRTLRPLRRLSGALTDWEQLWLDNSELYFIHRLWNRLATRVASPHVKSSENLELLIQLLEDSTPPVQPLTVSWLDLRHLMLMTRCFFALLLWRTTVSKDKLISLDRERERKIDITNDIIIPRIAAFLQSEHVESVGLREFSHEPSKRFDQPFTKLVDGISVSLGHDKHSLDALSHYYIANLMSDTCLEVHRPPNEFAASWAAALCRVVSTRNDEIFYDENIRDLFLAGLFISKSGDGEHLQWIKSRLGVLIQRSYFRHGGMDALMLSVGRWLLPFIDQAARCSSVREIWALKHENGTLAVEVIDRIQRIYR